MKESDTLAALLCFLYSNPEEHHLGTCDRRPHKYFYFLFYNDANKTDSGRNNRKHNVRFKIEHKTEKLLITVKFNK